MAKISYSDELVMFLRLENMFPDTAMLAGWDDGGFYVCNNGYIRITGKNLVYDDNDLTSGTINSIELQSLDRLDIVEISGLRINVEKKLGMLAGEDADMPALIAAVLAGRDKISGSNGGDLLTGGRGKDVISGRGGEDQIHGDLGNDRLKGGGGVDVFSFVPGDGKDVITDFDVTGPLGQYDFIDFDTDPGEVTVIKQGKNTVIQYGDGDTITLLNVSKADFVEIFY